jgi:SagB-type dehydrogenase family enzyme
MPDPIGKEFMRLTRYSHLTVSPQTSGEPQPPLQLPFPKDAEIIPLPKGEQMTGIPPADLSQVIEQRVSLRKYSATPLTLSELSFLLWCTQGVKQVSRRPVTLRTVPSAGARHAFETLVLVNRVEGLQPGIYRFLAIEHALLPVDLSAGLAQRLADACYQQNMVSKAAVTFFWVAVVERMTWRYVQRGYRYLHLDAGHVCQNLYLAGEAIGCGTCAIAAFEDETLNAALNLDGETQFIIYLAALGKKSTAN